MKKLLTIGMVFIVMMGVLSACGGSNGTGEAGPTSGNAGQPAPMKVDQPVKLTVYGLSAVGATGQALITRHVQEKYPNISFNFINSTGDGAVKVADLLASGTKVDIIFGSFATFSGLVGTGLMGDISDMVKKYGYDTSRFNPVYLDMIKNMSGGYLSGLPFYDLRLVLYYNKDLFDRFNVPYPKDGMKWTDLYDAARKLTQTQNGIQYRGFGVRPAQMTTGNQYSLGFVDANNKATLDTDKWKQWINTFLPFYQVPGFDPTVKMIQGFNNAFMKDQTTGMIVIYNSDAAAIAASPGLNWDAVTLPDMPDLPNVGSQPYPVELGLSANSDHRDAAFLAMTQMASDEVLAENAETLGAWFRESILEWQSPLIAQVRGKGLLNAIVIHPEHAGAAWELCLALKERGLLAKPTHDNKIRLAPPLVITKDQVEESLAILKTSLDTFQS